MHKAGPTSILACVLGAVPCASQAAAPHAGEPRPEDYAFAWPVETAASADFYELELTPEVYATVADPLLRDVGIFDANGRPVPRLVSVPPAQEAQPDATVLQPALPVHAPAGTELGDLRLVLVQRDGETQVRVDGARRVGAEAPLPVIAYITDLGEEHPPLRAVDLLWPEASEPLMTSVQVEGSPDLEQWRVIGSGTVAGITQDSARIERRRVELGDSTARYLRISWHGAPPGWSLSGLVVRYSRGAREPKRVWQSPSPAGVDDADAGYLYDLGGAPLVDRAAIVFAEDHALLRASLHCRLTAQDPWTRVHEGLFYRLRRDGDALDSDPAGLAPRRCRYWKVLVERGGRDSHVALRLGWQPDRLLFVAEGAGPWRLAAGSAQDVVAGFPQQRYADPAIREVAKTATLLPASLGRREELAGAAALRPPRGPDLRRWALWIGLVAGVLVVAGMAWRLAHSRPAPPAA